MTEIPSAYTHALTRPGLTLCGWPQAAFNNPIRVDEVNPNCPRCQEKRAEAAKQALKEERSKARLALAIETEARRREKDQTRSETNSLKRARYLELLEVELASKEKRVAWLKAEVARLRAEV